MKTFQDQINDAIRAFTETISKIAMVHVATTLGDTLGTFTTALGPAMGVAAAPPATPLASSGKAYVVHTGAADRLPRLTVHDAPPKPPKPGAKRPAHEIADMVTRVRAYIAVHPGKRIEQIAAGMGLAKTTPLQLPIVKLLRARAITKTGDRRATRYYPAKVARARKRGR